MKKTIIIILAALPIVLLMVIAIAGRILAIYQHIPVESVSFVDRVGNEYTDEMTFKVPMGGTKQTSLMIYPELASNKKVTYMTSNPQICTVDENGLITGVKYGFATVTVKSRDNSSAIAMLNVEVTANTPYAIDLFKDEACTVPATDVNITQGGTLQLYEMVDAPVAIDKSVIWTSSDTSVATVDVVGKVTAVAPGEAYITATTVLGGKTATCKVTVPNILPPVSFDFEGVDGVSATSNGYRTTLTSVNLYEHIVLGDGVTMDDVNISHTPLAGTVTLENGILTVTEYTDAELAGVKLVVTVGDVSDPEYKVEVRFAFTVE